MIEAIPPDKRAIIEKSNALLKGHFLLSSGFHSKYYLQCALILQYPEIAQMIADDIAKNFKDDAIDVVMSPAIGGIVIGQELARSLKCRAIFTERESGLMTLRRGFEIFPTDNVLLVEDVITTAGSILELKKVAEERDAAVVGFATIFDRSGGKFNPEEKFHSWQKLVIETFLPNECPLCKQGSTPYKPGSRK